MGGARSRGPRGHDARAARVGDLGRAATSSAPRRGSACAARRRRFEKGLAPEQAIDALAVATQLMVELCGAQLAPGRSTSTGRPAATVDARSGCATRASSGLLGAPIERARSAEILTALGFGVAPGGRRARRDGARFRRNDVTREADLIEEVARIDGVDKLPGDAARVRSCGRAADARAAAEAARPPTRSPAPGCTSPSAGAGARRSWRDRLRLPADDARRRAIARREPDVGRARADAHHAGRVAAGRRAAQRGAWRAGRRDLRVGRGVQAGRRRAAAG